MPLYLLTFIIAVSALIYYYKHRNKANYLDFDTLFLVTCYMIGFISSFFYGQFFYKALFFFDFNYSYLNSGAWLFTIGMTSYFVGSLSSKKRPQKILSSKSLVSIPSKPIFLFVLLGISLFIATGGISYYKDYYMGDKTVENSYASYLLLLISISVITMFSIEYVNRINHSNYKFHKSYIMLTLIFAIILLYCGSRTQALLLMLPVIGLYSLLFHPVKLKMFSILLALGIIGMWIVQNLRSSNEINTSLESPVLIFTDMTIPSRTTYEAMEYVDKNGITFGKTMSAAIIGLMPGMAGIIMGNDTKEFGSAEALTEYTYKKLGTPKEYQIGLGTNTVADTYLSFGLIGTIILMFFLARLINWFESQATVFSLPDPHILTQLDTFCGVSHLLEYIKPSSILPANIDYL